MWFVTNIIMFSFLPMMDNIAIATDKTKVNVLRFHKPSAMVNCLIHVYHAACTVKPVFNDHLYNEIYYLWFIQ